MRHPPRHSAAFFLLLLTILPAGISAQEGWQTVRIDADEYRFVPRQIHIREGRPVEILIRNTGNEEHEFRSSFLSGPLLEVRGGGVIVKSAEIHSIIVDNGSTATIRWLSPKAGVYLFECRIPSHHGMDGEIVVEDE